MGDLDRWLWVLPVTALVVTALRVSSSSEARKHRLLLLLIVATAVTILFGNFAKQILGMKSYAQFWVAAHGVIWALTALAITEACVRSLEPYEHFGRIGRRIINIVLFSTGLLLVAWLLIIPVAFASRFTQSQGYLVQGSLALLGLSIWGFANWAQLKLPFNSRLAMTAITVFCLGETLLGSGVPAKWPSLAFYIGIFWTTVCWGALAIRWAHRPEEVIAGPRRPLDDVAAASILAGMESTNSGLAQVVRRG